MFILFVLNNPYNIDRTGQSVCIIVVIAHAVYRHGAKINKGANKCMEWPIPVQSAINKENMSVHVNVMISAI